MSKLGYFFSIYAASLLVVVTAYIVSGGSAAGFQKVAGLSSDQNHYLETAVNSAKTDNVDVFCDARTGSYTVSLIRETNLQIRDELKAGYTLVNGRAYFVDISRRQALEAIMDNTSLTDSAALGKIDSCRGI